MFQWNDFVNELKSTTIEFEHLKVIQLAQAILESGRGQSDLFKLHGNPYGMKYRPEMNVIAIPVQYVDSGGEEDTYCKFLTLKDAAKGYWTFINRSVYAGWRHNAETPEDYIRFIAYAGYIGGPFNNTPEDRQRKEAYIGKVLNLVPEAKQLLGTVPPPPERIWKKRGVLLEVGHGPNPNGSEPGAVGHGGVREHDLNKVAAASAKAELDQAGIPCDITDSGASFYNIGRLAQGYDVFCSIHHNSAENPAQGAEALVHINKADPSDFKLADTISTELAQELGIRDRNKHSGTPRRALGVLSGAEDTDVRVSVLAEVYFIHVPVPNFQDWSTRGGKAIARAIIKWLKETA
jgi:N-acetylmuramoyl-L-alanine amidase